MKKLMTMKTRKDEIFTKFMKIVENVVKFKSIYEINK